MIRLFKNPIHKVKEAAAMKIVESAQKCNPEQIARNMNSIVDQLKSAVESAARDGDNYDSVERKTLESVLQIGFHALELLLALQGDGDLGEEVHTANEKIAKRSEAKSTTRLRSIFGEHSFEQFTYASGKTSRSACVPSAPVFRFPLVADRFCCKSSRKCWESIRPTTRR